MKRFIELFNYLVFLLVIVAVVDVLLFRCYLIHKYPMQNEYNDVNRYPVPYVGFTGKPGAIEYNELGFPGKSFAEAEPEAMKIAFFGGSTGFNGNPETIAEILERELEGLLNRKIFVANYSIIASNHRQHLHAMMEYLPDSDPDFIIFYGGWNELVQPHYADPRAGYPLNFYHRYEMAPWKKVLVSNSAIFSTLEVRKGRVSGLTGLRAEETRDASAYNDRLVSSYLETLERAEEYSGALRSEEFGSPGFMAFYQPYKVQEFSREVHDRVTAAARETDYLFDVSGAYSSLGLEIYTDDVHVSQDAREAMGQELAKLVAVRVLNRVADE